MPQSPTDLHHLRERRRRGLGRARTVTALVAGGSVVGVAALVDITAKTPASHHSSLHSLEKATSSAAAAPTTAAPTTTPTTTTPTTVYTAPQPVVSQSAPVQSGAS
jgi:hypothetical protein